jgi:hypothetical protein
MSLLCVQKFLAFVLQEVQRREFGVISRFFRQFAVIRDSLMMCLRRSAEKVNVSIPGKHVGHFRAVYLSTHYVIFHLDLNNHLSNICLPVNRPIASCPCSEIFFICLNSFALTPLNPIHRLELSSRIHHQKSTTSPCSTDLLYNAYCCSKRVHGTQERHERQG